MEQRNKSYRFVFYFLLLFSVVLIIIDINSSVNDFKVILSFIFNPRYQTQYITDFKNISYRAREILNCAREIEDVKKENSNLKEKLIIFNEMALENDKLKKILELKKTTLSGKYASVISYNPFEPYRFFYIDKGKGDGVERYNPILFYDETKSKWRLVGRVEEVYLNYSKVSLITSAGFSFVAMTSRSKGLATSRGNGLILYQYVDGDCDDGDEVFTANTSYTFPGGLYIGDLKKGDEWRISFVSVKDINYVYVVNWLPYIIRE